jgi:hypothetical protein
MPEVLPEPSLVGMPLITPDLGGLSSLTGAEL